MGSYGDEAVDLARLAGRTLDPEQELAVDAALSYGPGGKWVALESATIEGRQNGKTEGVLEPVTLFDLFLLPPDRMVWTAHLFRTSRASFMDFCMMIDYAPELSRRVKKIIEERGAESIELHSGAKLEFLARSRGGGRGLGGKRLVMDEAGFLSAEAMGALIPTLSARGDPHIDYGASAGLLTSDYLRRLVARGRAGGDPSLTFVEFCSPGGWADPPCQQGLACSHVVGTEGCALDDESLWPLANHSLGKVRANGTGLTYEYVRNERRALPPEEFGRERMGWHDQPPHGTDSKLLSAWAELEDHTASIGRLVLAVDVAPRGMSSSIGQCGYRSDRLPQVELVERRLGTVGLVDALDALAKRHDAPVGLDPSSEAGALIAPLEAAGVTVVQVGGREMAQACGEFDQTVTAKGLRHLGDPTIATALAGAVQKDYGDGARRWSRTTSAVDISPLVAVTIALHIHALQADSDPWGFYE